MGISRNIALSSSSRDDGGGASPFFLSAVLIFWAIMPIARRMECAMTLPLGELLPLAQRASPASAKARGMPFSLWTITAPAPSPVPEATEAWETLWAISIHLSKSPAISSSARESMFGCGPNGLFFLYTVGQCVVVHFVAWTWEVGASCGTGIVQTAGALFSDNGSTLEMHSFSAGRSIEAVGATSKQRHAWPSATGVVVSEGETSDFRCGGRSWSFANRRRCCKSTAYSSWIKERTALADVSTPTN